MLFDHDYSVDDPELNPMYETQQEHGGRFDKTQYAGYELSVKYNVLSPYKDALGLSLGLGYEKREKNTDSMALISIKTPLSPHLLQKNWLDNTLSWVTNIKTEFERRHSPGVLEEEIAFDISMGLRTDLCKTLYWVGVTPTARSSESLNTETGEYDEPSLQPSEFDLTTSRTPVISMAITLGPATTTQKKLVVDHRHFVANRRRRIAICLVKNGKNF